MKIAKNCPCCNSTNFAKSPSVLMPFIAKRVFGYDLISIDKSWNLFNFPEGLCLSQCCSCQCKECGFLFLDMRFDDEEMSSLYANYREDEYTIIRDFYEPGYAEKNKTMQDGIKYKPDIELFLSDLGTYNHVLDWGGDDGINTPFSNAEKVFIYDISGNQVINDFISLSENNIKKYKYDLIVCSNVLEHVSYPKDILSEITELMNDETILYIEVPFEKLMQNSPNSLEKYLSKKHWHEHINFFSENSLFKLTKNCGLEIVKKTVYGANVNQTISNIENVLMIACKKDSK